jgi:hypothetical protein
MFITGTAKLSDKMVNDIIFNGGAKPEDTERILKLHIWANRRWGAEVVSQQIMQYCLKELEEISKNR